MGQSSSQYHKELVKVTKFSKTEIQEMGEQFFEKFPNGLISRSEFVSELSSKAGTADFWSGIYDKFVPGEEFLQLKDFCILLSMISESSVDDKLETAFKMYDKDGNGYLDEKEVTDLVNNVFALDDRIHTSLANTVSCAPVRTVDPKKLFADMSKKNGMVSLKEFALHCKSKEDILNSVETNLLTTLKVEAKKRSELIAFGHQAAGHAGDKGLLKEGEFVYKHFSAREYVFYEQLRSVEKDPVIEPHMLLLPQYQGRTRVVHDDTGEVQHYLVLQDLTHGFKMPCILDTKMGKHTYEGDANLKKKATLGAVDKFTTSGSLGFRICGIRSYQVEKDTYEVKDKQWGTNVKQSGIVDAIQVFVDNGKEIRYDIVAAVLPELRKIEAFFNEQRKWKFVGSSILFVYDGATSDPKVNVKLVDFAHTTLTSTSLELNDGTTDDDYLFGIQNLINFFEQLEHRGELISIKIKLKGATDLVGKDSSGLSDPYVKMSIKGVSSQSSKTIKKELNPVWDQDFIFDGVHPEDIITFEVYDKERIVKDDLLGTTTFPVAKILDQSEEYTQTLSGAEHGALTFGVQLV